MNNQPQVVKFLDTDYRKEEKEEASDILQLLYLIKKSQHHYIGITKLQKLAFLTELEQQKKSIKGFNFLFYRWNYGAYSRDLQELCGMLAEFGIITRPQIKLTARGEKLLSRYSAILKRNAEIISFINSTSDQYSHHNSEKIKQIVYNTKVRIPGRKEPIKIEEINIEDRKRLLRKLSADESSNGFEISGSEAATLETEIDPELVSIMITKPNKQKLLTRSEVFGNV